MKTFTRKDLIKFERKQLGIGIMLIMALLLATGIMFIIFMWLSGQPEMILLSFLIMIGVAFIAYMMISHLRKRNRILQEVKQGNFYCVFSTALNVDPVTVRVGGDDGLEDAIRYDYTFDNVNQKIRLQYNKIRVGGQAYLFFLSNGEFFFIANAEDYQLSSELMRFVR